MELISIKSIVDYVKTCPFISDFSMLFTGYTDDTAGNCGVYDDGEKRVKKDMLGNELKRHKYALVARNPTQQDIDRIRSTDFCQRFQTWVDEQEGAGNYPVLPNGYQAFSISAADARLNARAQDGKTAVYEIPFEIEYWRFTQYA